MPVPPLSSFESPSRASPVLDYHARRPSTPSENARLMCVCGVAAGLIGVAILGGLAEALRETWPSFGMALAAAPIGLVAFAFLSLAVTAFRGMRA